MGLLVLGEPVSWKDTAALRFYVKYHGIIQFIKAYNKHKNRKCDRFLWGDEIECLLLHMDANSNQVQAQLRANQILDELHKEQAQKAENDPGSELNITFHPEYANNMLEVTPFIPYGGSVSDLLAVETNMRYRRAVLQSKLRVGEFVMYACNFPLFGTPGFTRVPPDNKICPKTPINISTSTNASTLEVFAFPKGPEDANSPNTSLEEIDGIDLPSGLPGFDVATVPGTTPGAGTGEQQQQQQQHSKQLGPVLRSSYVPDEIMSPHPRFATLSGNIRRRRGKKVDIALPMYKDDETDLTQFPDGNIHSDAMGFGMGSCCLQVTFQTHSNTEARFLYDQMAVLAPIFLSLTANTPFHRGHIVDSDVRWDTICQSVDDRTDGEKGLLPPLDPLSLSSAPTPALSSQQHEDIPELLEENPYLAHFRNKTGNVPKVDEIASSPSQTPLSTTPLSVTPLPITRHPQSSQSPAQIFTIDDWSVQGIGVPYNDLPISVTDPSQPNHITGPPRIYKSRYSSIDCYISNDPRFGYHPKFNDVIFPYHEPSYELLRENGVDSLMSKHIASLWIRDPLVMFHGQISQDDNTQVNHFESIQSTNWRSVRYKPPSHAENPGFRVEFRTMELNMTDFENAAFSVFLALLARAIVHFELNLYIPLTKVDENFIYAHRNHSVKNDKFWFKTGLQFPATTAPPSPTHGPSATPSTESFLPDSQLPPNANMLNQLNFSTTQSNGSGSIKLTARGCCTPCCGSQQDLMNIPIESFTLSRPAQIPDSISDTISDDETPLIPVEQISTPLQQHQQLAANAKLTLPGVQHHLDLNAVGQTPSFFTGSTPSLTKPYCDMTRIDQNWNDNCKLMTVNDIINGSSDFIGFIPIVRHYLDVIDIDEQSMFIINQYLKLIAGRADLSLLTGAQFQRQFMLNHPSYKNDSILPHDAVRDLMMVMHGISNQTCHIPELIGALDPALEMGPKFGQQGPAEVHQSTLHNDLFDIPVINLPMADLLEQLKVLPCTNPSQDGHCTENENSSKLQQIINRNRKIVLTDHSPSQPPHNDEHVAFDIKDSSVALELPSEESCQQPKSLPTQPETNPRSNYWRLIQNPHTRTLDHAFTAALGEHQLELQPNLKGSKRNLDMQSLHGHQPQFGVITNDPPTTSFQVEKEEK